MVSPITLDQVPLAELVAAFCDAFAVYAVRIEMTDAKLENLIRARSVRLDRSYGYLEGDRLAAFILTGSRKVDGHPTAYNSAMGVRQDRQRQGLGRSLLTFTMDHLQAYGYRRYLLEVITTNTAAHRLYLSQGFRQRRLLHSYTAKASAPPSPGNESAVMTVLDPGWARRIAPLLSHPPTWQNAVPSVDAIADHCRLITAGPVDVPAAMAVLDPRFGVLHQFGFAHGESEAARQVVALAMREAANSALNLINMDNGDARMNSFLEAAGFERTVSQYEMEFSWYPVRHSRP
jgi:ribosomal protein S18 acetylase RimI-like enzyme